jgi:hypothetical protein
MSESRQGRLNRDEHSIVPTGLKYKDTSTLTGHKWQGYYQLPLQDNGNGAFQTASRI